jgi:hypothetical protein
MFILDLVTNSITAFIILVACYVAGTHYKVVKNRGYFDETFSSMGTVKQIFYVVGWVVFIVGIILDVLFNWTVGCLIFKEGWRGGTFTSRLHWHKENSSGRNLQIAQEWCDALNQFDDGHC